MCHAAYALPCNLPLDKRFAPAHSKTHSTYYVGWKGLFNMGNVNPFVAVAFVLYFGIVLGIGIYFYRRSKNVSDYFLGGRSLNSWVTALSAQASDMSGWLLMGLPGALYLSGLCEAWIAIGLGIGTYLNWLLVGARLRQFSYAAGDSITIPQYFQNRFKSTSAVVRVTCAVIIFVFFLFYTASAFSAGAKLFENVFGWNYTLSLTIGAVIILAYTFMGGFLAVSWTDFFQGILMLIAIIIVPIIAISRIPDFSIDTLRNAKDGFLSFTQGRNYDFRKIISGLAWGLGYFGMPHILVRFMAIKSHKMIKQSRRIAMVWVVLSLIAAVFIGLVGFVYLNGQGVVLEAGASEYVFIELVKRLFPGFIAGILLSAILAATMSTADSQLLVTASAVSNDFYKVLIKKNASEKELMHVSRIAVLIIAVLAYLIALDPDSTIMGLVSNAWAGFGAAFGPAILFSIYWKRLTLKGVVAGMISGGVVVIAWLYVPFLAATELYALIPGFIISVLFTVVVSLIDKEPTQDVKQLFETALKSGLNE